MSNVFFYEPFYDFDRFFDEAFFGRQNEGGRPQQRRVTDGGDGAVRPFKPRMDLHENAENNLVTASFEFPGVKKEDVQIDVHNGRLIVSAETKESTQHDEGGYAVRERRYGKYSRTLQLPQGVKDNEIKANMDNGILTVTFPKSIPELAPKRIAVQ